MKRFLAPSRLRPALPLLLLVGLSYPLFFHHLGERDLWSSHEARAAQNARMMLETGQWGLPRRFDGKAELQKPPLSYWLVAALGWLRDGAVDGWAVRLPAAGAALGCVLVLLILGQRRGRPVAGLLGGLTLASMVHFTWMARVGRIDMPLSLSVAVILSCYYLGYRASGGGRIGAARCWLLAAYLAAAVSILLKGPVGVVLAGVVISFHLLLEGELARGEGRPPWRRGPEQVLRLSRVLGLWWGVPLVLLAVLPWFLWANHQTQGEFFRVFFVRHNLQRGLGGDEQFETHFHPWWFYGYRLAVDLQPWSVVLPIAGWFLWRRGWWRDDPEARFGCVWLVAMTLLLSLLEYKRADYLLPAYPGAALLLGCAWERWLQGLLNWQRRLAWSTMAAVVLACVVGWLVYVGVFLPRWEPAREQHRFAATVRRYVPCPGLVILFRVEGHALVHHLGHPLDRIWEWENLDIWACQPGPIYVVMPASEVPNWPQHMEAGRLYPIASNTDASGAPHEDPLVLVCTRPVQP